MSDLQARPIRLHAFLAAAGIASRRFCEELIKQGRVEVDGQLASIGQKVYGTEDIRVNGQPIPALLPKKFRYILLNKPPGYLSSMRDPQGRPCAIDLIVPRILDRLYNIGRLDQWSSGLLIFTNDGNFAAQLMHPSSEIDKEYFVQTDNPFPPGFAASFMRGIILEGVRYRAQAVRVVAPDKAHIVLIEGKNREIRRVLEHFGLHAKILERIRIGPLFMGDLNPGQWRELTEEEVLTLKEYMSSRTKRKRLQK